MMGDYYIKKKKIYFSLTAYSTSVIKSNLSRKCAAPSCLEEVLRREGIK